MTAAPDGFRQRAFAAVFWSVAQNWGGRALGLVVFFVLARLLSPADFGTAASAILVFSFVSLVAELGFGDALLQRPRLRDSEATLPFIVAVGAATVLALATIASAGAIARLLRAEHLGPFIAGAACFAPLAVAAGFQDAMYRRALRFRDLALRTLAASIVAGAASIAAALAGLGAGALIVQFGLQIVVSLVWLWLRPAWVPTRELDVASFRAIGCFGFSVAAMRIVDFAAMRTVDVLILANLGASALGLFAISSRLYQFLMQLLQASITNAGLAVLSRVAEDRARMAELFVRTTSLTAMVCSPVFTGLAALAPEANALMFGARWAQATPIMALLLLVGSIHCLLFGAGAYLTALGRPGVLLRLMLLKAGLVLGPLILLRPQTLDETAQCFALGLIAEAPFTLHATLRALGLPWRRLARPVGAPLVAGALAFAVVMLERPLVEARLAGLSASGVHALCFVAVYAAATLLLARAELGRNIDFLPILRRWRGRWGNKMSLGQEIPATKPQPRLAENRNET